MMEGPATSNRQWAYQNNNSKMSKKIRIAGLSLIVKGLGKQKLNRDQVGTFNSD